jgi:ubiquinone/menaquinone biosynthesis C-methylase UbiE
VIRFDDPAVVAKQYADEANLRARQALWANVEGENGRIVLARVLSSLEPRRVLEVGGGQGELAEWMQDELEAEVTFVDQSERMVDLARARGIERASVGDVQALTFADGSYDTVVAAWMLYHVADLDRAFSEIVRVLDPGGRLVAVTNSVRHLEELRAVFGTIMPGFDKLFNAENAEELLGRYFSRIERHDTEIVAVVEDRETLVAYRQSLSYESRPVPDDIPLPFRVHGRTSIFVAYR